MVEWVSGNVAVEHLASQPEQAPKLWVLRGPTAFLFACHDLLRAGLSTPLARKGVSQMLVGSLIAFVALVISWMVLPDTGKTSERVETTMAPARTLATEA